MSVEVIVKAITSGFSQFQWQDALDILIITILLYRLIRLTKETRAYQVIKGIGMLFIAAMLCQLFGLTAMSWLLNSLLASGIVVMVVLFQPELRRALEHIGRGKIFDKSTWTTVMANSSEHTVHEIQNAVINLSRRRVGALIVIEQKTGLGDIISTGTAIGGIVSAALLENIFEPNTPLHDGASIVRGSNIVAAGCFLPLSDEGSISRELGTRHRAALGVSSVSDSITIVVSEETGVISYAKDGKLIRYIDAKALNDLLESIYTVEKSKPLTWLKRRGKNDGKDE